MGENNISASKSKEIELYPYDKQIGKVFDLIKKDLSGEDYDLAKEYDVAMVKEALSKASRLKNLKIFLSLGRLLNKKWLEVTKSDIDQLIVKIMDQFSNQGKETETSRDHKKILKLFYRWHKLGSRSFKEVGDPPETKGIRLKKPAEKIVREALIDEKDISNLLSACGENSRDRAFLHVHYEAATRPGEILSLRLKHVKFDEFGAIIYVDGKIESIVPIPKYLDFVDSVFSILNTKNHKPIFVPLSLRTSQKDIEQICLHYLSKDYLNFWIDFEGKSINEQSMGRLRYLYRILKEKEQFKNVVFYYTNIKREIISNTKIDKSPASDVLAAISGANIIGVNREPQRPFFGEISKEIIEHKSRILDRRTYYYLKTDDKKFSKKDANVSSNAIKLNEEFESQTSNFLKEMTIVNSIKKKDMLKENEKILKALTTKPLTRKKLDNWF